MKTKSPKTCPECFRAGVIECMLYNTCAYCGHNWKSPERKTIRQEFIRIRNSVVRRFLPAKPKPGENLFPNGWEEKKAFTGGTILLPKKI